MLTAEGYRVVHLSRHGSYEEGKDVLAVAPDRTPCAFQLKGSSSGKMSQREWGKYIDQVNRLVEIPIKHPSIDESLPRKVYFVTNGELDEEVRVEITNRNSDWKRRGHPQLEVIVRDELLRRFIQAQDNLWPLQLSSEKQLLELYLADGTGYLDKSRFAAFLERLFLAEDGTRGEIPRRLASLAIITAYAVSPYSLLENHVALIEGWTIYLGFLTALVDKLDVPERSWIDNANLAIFAIESSLANLCDELKQLRHYVAGNSLVDAPFYRGRLTWVMSLVCVYLLRQQRLNSDWQADSWFDEFVLQNYDKLELGGEAVVPQILAVSWCLSSRSLAHLGDRLIYEMVQGIVDLNRKGIGISDPYHPLAEVAMMKQGFTEKAKPERFGGRSYTLESLVMLCARRGWRGLLADLWKPITAIHYAEYQLDSTWQYGLPQCEDGKLVVKAPKAPQSWGELRHISMMVDPPQIPCLFQRDPEVLLLFLITHPHRLQTAVIRYIDSLYYRHTGPQEL